MIGWLGTASLSPDTFSLADNEDCSEAQQTQTSRRVPGCLRQAPEVFNQYRHVFSDVRYIKKNSQTKGFKKAGAQV